MNEFIVVSISATLNFILIRFFTLKDFVIKLQLVVCAPTFRVYRLLIY